MIPLKKQNFFNIKTIINNNNLGYLFQMFFLPPESIACHCFFYYPMLNEKIDLFFYNLLHFGKYTFPVYHRFVNLNMFDIVFYVDPVVQRNLHPHCIFVAVQ